MNIESLIKHADENLQSLSDKIKEIEDAVVDITKNMIAIGMSINAVEVVVETKSITIDEAWVKLSHLSNHIDELHQSINLNK